MPKVTYINTGTRHDLYTWGTGDGANEFRAEEKEQDFIQWATEQGYEVEEAVLVMAESGDEFDCPLALVDAWPAWLAGYNAGRNSL